jgi:hypothetical protein
MSRNVLELWHRGAPRHAACTPSWPVTGTVCIDCVCWALLVLQSLTSCQHTKLCAVMITVGNHGFGMSGHTHP